MDDLLRGYYWLQDAVLTAVGYPPTRYLCAVALRVEVYEDAQHTRISDMFFATTRRKYACKALQWPHNVLKTTPIGVRHFHPDMPIEEIAWHTGDLTHLDLEYGPLSETFGSLTNILTFDKTPIKLQYRQGTDQVDFSLQPMLVVVDAHDENAYITPHSRVENVTWKSLDVVELDRRCHLRCRDAQIVQGEEDMASMTRGTRYRWDINVADPSEELRGSVVINSAFALTNDSE